MEPKFTSDIELIRAEAIDAIHALAEHLEVGASSRWGPFFACIGERNYPKAASFYETLAVKGDLSFASVLAGVLANLWQAKYEEARSAASRLADGSTFDERSYERIMELIEFATEVEGTYANRELADVRPRVPARTRFVILHDFRVGSTWVVASLNQHERVICYPEFLVGATAEQQARLLSLVSTGGLPEIFGVYAVSPKYHPVSPYRKKHIDALGFKTKLHDIRDHSSFRTFLKENEFKVIRLYREDVLRQAVSLCNAERLFSERGQYNVRSGIDERAGPLRLDSKRLLEKINRLREERGATDEFVKTLELPTLSLSYEEMLEDPSTAASRLGACLEIDGLTLGAAFAKATSDKLEEAVENWDEIIPALKGTPYEPSEEQLKILSATSPFVYSHPGICPICDRSVRFRSKEAWYRDHLMADGRCAYNGCIPRERALGMVVRSLYPTLAELSVHESSPCGRGASLFLEKSCGAYVATQFFPDEALGATVQGWRNENLERQTFADQAFDLVVTQDVMEHVFDPAAVFREVSRTLKPGGSYVFTVPTFKGLIHSERRAELDADGSVRHLMEPEYHDSPVGSGRSLVTFHYGYDLPELIAQWCGMDVEVRRFHDHSKGIIGEFTEVYACRKPLPQHPADGKLVQPGGDSAPDSGVAHLGPGALQVPAAAAYMHIFTPAEPGFLATLPKSLAASGNLDRVNGVAAPADLNLWRGAATTFSGWCCRTEETHGRADSRYFFLERGDGQFRYYVHVPSRIQRDDVAGAVPELSNWVTRFSGFDFVADLQHLQPGEYRLGVVHETEEACYEFVFAKTLRVFS